MRRVQVCFSTHRYLMDLESRYRFSYEDCLYNLFFKNYVKLIELFYLCVDSNINIYLLS